MTESHPAAGAAGKGVLIYGSLSKNRERTGPAHVRTQRRDQLSLAIVVGSLVLDLVSMFVAPHHCGWGMRCTCVHRRLAFALFRIFSQESHKRRSENQRWVNWMWRMKSSRQNAKARHADQGPQILHLQEL